MKNLFGFYRCFSLLDLRVFGHRVRVRDLLVALVSAALAAVCAIIALLSLIAYRLGQLRTRTTVRTTKVVVKRQGEDENDDEKHELDRLV